MYMFCSRCIRLRKYRDTDNRERNVQEERTGAGEDSGTAADESTADTSELQENAPQTSGNILVAYFSWADNAILADDVDAVASPSVIPPGNVQQLAGWVQEETGGDLFPIQVTEPYSSDWDECLDRANQERRDDARPELEESVENLSDYDTVFLGYPIWWGIAAWPVDSFVEANDFTGKTVIPFCTSASSGLGDSGALLAEMAGTGDWQEGMRFRSGADEADVQEWVSGLGL